MSEEANYKNIYVSAELLMEFLDKRKAVYTYDFKQHDDKYYVGVIVGLDIAIGQIEKLIGEGHIMSPNPLESWDVNT